MYKQWAHLNHMLFIKFKVVVKILTHFQPMIQFYTPWKHQKTWGFLMFLDGIELDFG